MGKRSETQLDVTEYQNLILLGSPPAHPYPECRFSVFWQPPKLHVAHPGEQGEIEPGFPSATISHHPTSFSFRTRERERRRPRPATAPPTPSHHHQPHSITNTPVPIASSSTAPGRPFCAAPWHPRLSHAAPSRASRGPASRALLLDELHPSSLAPPSVLASGALVSAPLPPGLPPPGPPSSAPPASASLSGVPPPSPPALPPGPPAAPAPLPDGTMSEAERASLLGFWGVLCSAAGAMAAIAATIKDSSKNQGSPAPGEHLLSFAVVSLAVLSVVAAGRLAVLQSAAFKSRTGRVLK
ncbi:hypothetical protein CSOJ01_06898 [Colletotrichum sojae]|uniref:Uncharacterized protein n=1 Tax=Colletotrichum sojae TaxID=2175907 RepID=A0A8H6MV59_9PEZI|nr:hypothetical protein CSOJ01_06898 [Colletotrichum sojae]